MIQHLVSRRNDVDDSSGRLGRAQRSWQLLYDVGALRECHHWDECKTTTTDDRQLPLLKEVVEFGLSKCQTKSDPVLFTNDDIIIHPCLILEIKRHIRLFGAGVMRRVDVEPDDIRFPDMLMDAPLSTMAVGRPHIGRDGFIITGEWWGRWGSLVPDFYLGAPRWDFCLALLIRRISGFDIASMDVNQLYQNHQGCDLPDGLLFHETHVAKWTEDDKEPKREHNEELFSEFCDRFCKGLDSHAVKNASAWHFADVARYLRLYTNSTNL